MLTFAPAVCPQMYQSPREFTANVRRAEFEGGYSQRSRTGPNAISQVVHLQWDVAESVADAVEAFFVARGGAEAFRYQLPWSGSELIWTCTEWTKVPLGARNGEKMWRVRATFKQEFDIL